MKKITAQFAQSFQNSSRILLAAAALCTGAAIVVPTAASAATAAAAKPASHLEGIDAFIAKLHDSLKITSAQEDKFSAVAQVMRDNAAQLDTLVKARADGAATATAVDDLKSYEAISSAHEEGTKKLIPVFQALYDSMSDDQKKVADASFRGGRGGRPSAATKGK